MHVVKNGTVDETPAPGSSRERRAIRLVETGWRIAKENAADAGEMAFSSPHLINCTLPHSDPGEAVFTRRTPWLELRMVGDPAIGLPYGSVARLFLAQVQTDVVRTRSPVVRLGASLTDTCLRLGMPNDGRAVKRFREQLFRCFSTTWFCTVTDRKANVTERMRFQFGSKIKYQEAAAGPMRLEEREVRQLELWEPVITVDHEFFTHLLERPVPFDMRALKVLARSPLAMDLYTWCAAKAPLLKQPFKVEYWQLMEQWGSEYPKTKHGRADFRKRLQPQLKAVSAVWPELQLERTVGGLIIHPSKPHVRAVR